MQKNNKNIVIVNVSSRQDLINMAVDLHKIACVYSGKISNAKKYTAKRKIFVVFKAKKRLTEFISHLKRISNASLKIEIPSK